MTSMASNPKKRGQPSLLPAAVLEITEEGYADSFPVVMDESQDSDDVITRAIKKRKLEEDEKMGKKKRRSIFDSSQSTDESAHFSKQLSRNSSDKSRVSGTSMEMPAEIEDQSEEPSPNIIPAVDAQSAASRQHSITSINYTPTTEGKQASYLTQAQDLELEAATSTVAVPRPRYVTSSVSLASLDVTSPTLPITLPVSPLKTLSASQPASQRSQASFDLLSDPSFSFPDGPTRYPSLPLDFIYIVDDEDVDD